MRRRDILIPLPIIIFSILFWYHGHVSVHTCASWLAGVFLVLFELFLFLIRTLRAPSSTINSPYNFIGYCLLTPLGLSHNPSILMYNSIDTDPFRFGNNSTGPTIMRRILLSISSDWVRGQNQWFELRVPEGVCPSGRGSSVLSWNYCLRTPFQGHG